MDSCKAVLNLEPVAKSPAVDQPIDTYLSVLFWCFGEEFQGNWAASYPGNPMVPGALSPDSRASRSPLFTTKARKNKVPGEEAEDLICHKIFSEK